jgi:hypothetical protein
MTTLLVSPVAADRLYRIHQTSVRLHRTLDRIDPTDSKGVAAVLVATLIRERRSYRAPDPIRSAHDDRIQSESDDNAPEPRLACDHAHRIRNI